MQTATRSEPTPAKSMTPRAETAKSSSEEFSELVDEIIERTGLRKNQAWHQAADEKPELYARLKSEQDQLRAVRESQQRQQEARERAERITASWNQTAGRFSACRFERFEIHGTPEEQAAQQRIVSALSSRDVMRMAEDGQNLLFVGPPGSGKDHLMHALAWRALHQLDGRIITRNEAALRQQLKKAVMESADSEAALLRQLIDTRLLLISDPVPTGGKELSDFQADSLYHVVDQRWTSKRPIWATLNLPVEAMRDAAITSLTAPVWDRLKDGALIVVCNWQSFRKPAEVLK